MNQNKFLRPRLKIVSLLAVMIACAGIGTPVPLRAQSATKVNLLLDWTPNTNHLGFYVAQELGYYKDLGLDVEIQQPGDGVLVDQVVATGIAEFGVSYQEQFSYSRAADLPIVSVAAIIQHNTSGFAALKEKHDLKTPADLVGLRYGAFGSPVEKPIIDSLVACAKVKEGSVEMIDIGYSEPFPLMEKDRIDFVWLFYGWDEIRAKQAGLDVSFLMLKDYTDCVPDYYTPILITNETLIKDKPDEVKAFVNATAKGYAYAISHPKEAADMLIKAAPDLDANLVTESAAYLADQFQADAPRWGEQKAEVWEKFTQFMLDNKALEKTFDTKKAFTNAFLPE